MPVVRSSIPYRKSHRLRQTDPKDFDEDYGLWETYDEALLAPCPVKSEPSYLPLLPPDFIESGHIPRPRNAFICFRSEYVKAQKLASAQSGSVNQTVLSRGAADVWRELSAEEREPYTAMAHEEKEQHALKYPNYRYSPGSASGAARKNKKAKPTTPRRPSIPCTQPRTCHKYETNPPAPRATRKKSSPVTPRRRRASTSAAPTAVAPVAQAAAPSTPPPLHEDKPDESKITRSPVRPSSYDRKPAHFGSKRDLSPRVVATERSPSPTPSIDIPSLSLDDHDSPAPSPPRSPSPPAFVWDDWMYAPLELNEDDLHFDVPTEDFGFFHPWNLDDFPIRHPPSQTDSFLIT
ncbi:hypothetical protein DFH06DRAFT_594600 [Mycena polygramma]|nr:hypothetical protein DFH06DRAFT_594600 [Mycena polygramma]